MTRSAPSPSLAVCGPVFGLGRKQMDCLPSKHPAMRLGRAKTIWVPVSISAAAIRSSRLTSRASSGTISAATGKTAAVVSARVSATTAIMAGAVIRRESGAISASSAVFISALRSGRANWAFPRNRRCQAAAIGLILTYPR